LYLFNGDFNNSDHIASIWPY